MSTITDVWTPADVAAYLDVTEPDLKSWRNRGTGPRCARLTRRTYRYLAADVAEYAEARAFVTAWSAEPPDGGEASTRVEALQAA